MSGFFDPVFSYPSRVGCWTGFRSKTILQAWEDLTKMTIVVIFLGGKHVQNISLI